MASCGRLSRRHLWNSASTSARSSWSARSAHRGRLQLHCSVSAARDIEWTRIVFRKDGYSQRHAMNSSNAPHSFMRSAPARSTPWTFLLGRSMCLPNRSFLRRHANRGARTNCINSYRELPRAQFDAVIEMLSEGIATQRGRSGAFLHRDQINGIVRGRRGARLAAITSGGAIPENANYYVIAEPDETIVGTLDEDFAVESLAGDVFLLGTTSWRIRRVEAGRVRVEDAHGAAPSIPFWRGEAPGRTVELSEEVANIREQIAQQAEAVEWLMEECALDRL